MDDLAVTARLWGIEPEYYDGLGRPHTAAPEVLTRLIDAISAGHAQPQHLAPVASLGASSLGASSLGSSSLGAPSHHAQTAFQGDGRRLWALAVQLYALRSRRNWGHGDFTDLARLIEIAAARGVAAIGLNPLHALFADHADDASPYSPNSRLFLNPLYIDVEAIDEFPGAAEAGLQAEIAALRDTELVAYGDVARAKLAALHLAHERFRENAKPDRRDDFESYRRAQGEMLLRFSCFEVLRRKFTPAPWHDWPQRWRHPERERLRAFRNEHDADCEFHEFVQWIAERQLVACQAAARRQGMPIGLYTDLAVGIDRNGADAWTQQDAVMADVAIGAPPDELNPAGQNWGLAPFNPQALPENDFAVMRQLMDVTMRHAGAVRLDHVFGLQRLFLFPRGGAGGSYVRFPFEALLRVVAQESNRHRCIVVGEDLGTVPENFRETMARWGLWGCRVMLFEREGDSRFRAPENYPAQALASFATHDMASFRGWMEGYDLGVKRVIGLDPGESDDSRARDRAALRDALRQSAPGYAPDDIAGVAAFLAATPSRLVAMSLDDVLGVREQINIPGIVDQHPNWRRKLPVTIEELATHQGLARVARVFQQAGRGFTLPTRSGGKGR